MPKIRYTEDEIILALLLYMSIERKDIRRDNEQIRRLSDFFIASGYDRSVGSVKAKLENFKAFDPMYEGKGMAHTSKADSEVWNRFSSVGFINLAEEAEKAADRISKGRVLQGEWTADGISGTEGGKTGYATVKERINQSIFRSRVLEAYGFRCCITGIKSPELIQACHIKGWSECPENSPERLDPRNGLCMDILHHRSFDKGLFTVDEHYRMELSPKLQEKEDEDVLNKFYYPYEGKEILPEVMVYKPSQKYLDWHRKNVFIEG